MKKIIIEFGNLEQELKTKGLELYYNNRINSMFIKDNNNNMYIIETYFHASYLDGLIADKARATFTQVSDENLQYIQDVYLKKLA